MQVKACYVSNTGKVRRANEDSLLLNKILVVQGDMEKVRCYMSSDDRQIFALADGMGGHAKGEVASKTVLEIFKEKYTGIEDAEGVQRALKFAKEGLNNLVTADENAFGLGTTVAGIVLSDSSAVVFNCGDSRVYKFNGDFLDKISRDHSIVQELADNGEITEDEMRTHPHKNIVTSALIGDLKDIVPRFYSSEIPVADIDRFLLCTDGVWESMSLYDLSSCLTNKAAEDAADCLFKKTLTSGARDNLSLIIIDILP